MPEPNKQTVGARATVCNAAAMQDVLTLIAPVFLIILVGFGTGKTRILDSGAIKGIGAYVFHIALPMLLFHTMATRDITPLLRFELWASYYFAGFTVFALTLLIWSTVFKHARIERGLMAFTATFSNTVLVSLPIVLLIFGDRALLPMLMLTSVHALTYLPIAVVIILFDRQSGEAWHVAVRTAVWQALSNPIVLSIAGGALYGASTLPLPEVLNRTLELVGLSAGPTALFVLGAALSEFKLAGHKAEIGVLVFLKLAVHPFLAWLLAAQVFALDPLLTGVVVLAAATPSGINAFILAQHYGTGLQRASGAVLVSTALSVVTFSILMLTVLKDL